MHVEVHFEEGAEGSLHTQPYAQTTYVLEGEFEFTIGDETRIVKRGVLMDAFSPIREDFLK